MRSFKTFLEKTAFDVTTLNLSSEFNKLNKLLPINSKLVVDCKKINPSNINTEINYNLKKLDKENIESIDFFSIDIDSSDIFCVNALLEFRPRLICIEYNAKFPPPVKISIGQNFNKNWVNDDYYGSSLSYIVDEMEKKEYKLISTNISGSNAFFTTKELYPLCKTYNQSINDLYMSANHNLYDYYVADKPTNKFLKDILKTNL